MNQQEPVNLMGVIAFPNPDPDKRVIRFIDSSYNTLFTIPDGSSIVLTRFNGERTVLPCEYIDDYHALIGQQVMHICQFAEIQERNGATYAPEHPGGGAVGDTYEIYQLKDAADYRFRPYAQAKDSLKFTDYQRAYAGMLASEISLADLFAKHNQDNRPFGREMRSLSVSDVLVLNRNGQRSAYYVDSGGFEAIPKFLPQKHKPKKKDRGEAR